MRITQASTTLLLSVAMIAGPFVGASAAVTAPAGNGGGVNAQTDPETSTVTIGAGFHNSTPGKGGSKGSGGSKNTGGGSSAVSNPSCEWITLPLSANPGGVSNPNGTGTAGSAVAPGTAGTWYYLSCIDWPVGQALGSITTFVAAGQQVQQLISPQMLAEQAESGIQLEAPPTQLSPMPSADQWEFVNVPTWAWVPASSWIPLHATAAAGPVVVTATATPEKMVISYQDGTAQKSVTCTGPGTPYSDDLAQTEDPQQPLRAASPDCGWIYQNSSSGASKELEPVSASVTYDVSWTVTGAAGGGDLGLLRSPATTYQVKVGEVQALITGTG